MSKEVMQWVWLAQREGAGLNRASGLSQKTLPLAIGRHGAIGGLWAEE